MVELISNNFRERAENKRQNHKTTKSMNCVERKMNMWQIRAKVG